MRGPPSSSRARPTRPAGRAGLEDRLGSRRAERAVQQENRRNNNNPVRGRVGRAAAKMEEEKAEQPAQQEVELQTVGHQMMETEMMIRIQGRVLGRRKVKGRRMT